MLTGLSRSQAANHRHQREEQPYHRKWHHHHPEQEEHNKSHKMATAQCAGSGSTERRRIDHQNYNNKNQRCQNEEPEVDNNLRANVCVQHGTEPTVDDGTHRIRPRNETKRRRKVSDAMYHKRKPSFWLILFVTTVCIILATQTPTTTTAATPTSVATSLSMLTAISPFAFTQWGSLTIAAVIVGGGFSSLVTIGDAAAVVTTYEPSPHTEFKFQIVDEEDVVGGGGGEEEDDDDDDDAAIMGDVDGAAGLNEVDSEIEIEAEAEERQDEDDDEGGDYSRYRNRDGYYERRLRYRPQEIPLPPLNVFEVNVDFDDIEPTAGVVSTLKPHDANDDKLQKKKSVTKRSSSGLGDSTSANANGQKESLSLTSSTTPLASTTASTTTVTTLQGGSVKITMPSTTVQTSGGVNGTETDEKCEPKVLSEIPTEPYYDYTELIEMAARQFTEFLANQFPAGSATNLTDQLRDEVRRKANTISTTALNEDTNLLAFAIAAPSIHTVVVKFRDNVTIPPEQVHNKGFLGSYWRELGYAWNSTENSQEWGAPFRDCNLIKGRWLWPFRLSFTEANIKIVAAAFIAADEDVCNDDLEEIFGRRHGCDRNTTFCLLTGEGKPSSSREAYTCICRETFYLPNTTVQGFRGDIVEESEGYNNYSCIPCPGGCTHCDQHGVCLMGEPQEAVSLENLLKVTVGSVLGACILCCVVLSVIVFRQRKCKAIASGMWTVLETILLGIVLLYASVAVHFFPASTERCLIEPWLRELGFITCYGAIILKLYRHLVDFRTRKAHRWVLRDVDLLKYLGTMIFAVICYMCAFTASSLDLLETGQLESLREVRTNTCLPMKWEYVTQASEILILCFGLHLSFASRNANTQFRERQFLVATLVLEFLVSTTFYTLRAFYLPEMSPGTTFLALFLRSLLTNTVAIFVIFVPKLWYQHKQVRSLAHDLSIRLPVDAFKGSHDAGQRLGGGYAGLCLGDPDIGELTISEMSPEDIRAELKRLYTQLEILKNKTLRQDNPHISKRRGGRKAGHRRFSLQALSAKHRSNKHHQDIEITEAEPSRTPEDSVCSAEGPTDTYAEISGISHSMLSHSMVSHSVVSHSK